MPNLVRDSSGMRDHAGARVAAVLHEAAAAADGADGDAAGLDAALEALCQGLDDVFVAVLMLDHERLWLAATSRYTMIPDGLALEDGVVGRAVRERATQYVDDPAADADFLHATPGVASQVAVPLCAGDRPVGVLSIESTAVLPRPPADALGVVAESLARRLDGLRTSRVVDLSMLARLFVYVSSLRDPGAIADVTCRAFARIVPLDTSQLIVVDELGGLIESSVWRASPEGPPPLPHDVIERLHGRLDRSAVFDVLDGTDPAVDAGPRRIVAVPLRANGADLGLLVGSSRFAREFERRQGEAAALLAAHAAASLDAAFLLSRERQNALTDPLTGLLNRRGFDIELERELEASQSDRRPVSVVIFDCDDFKEVNDRAGHEFGDALLRELSDVLVTASGADPCVARLGGDEFVIMMSDADCDIAAETANEIRDRLSSGISDAGFPMHVSGGVSTYPYDGATGSQLLRAADQALYDAKERGKNRISTFRDVVRMGAEPGGADGARGRGSGRSSSGTLAEAAEAAAAIWEEQTVDAVLSRLVKSLTFVVGATGGTISRLVEGTLVDASSHSLRDTTLGEDAAYLIDDFPLTKAVLEQRRPRAISFLDAELDRSEAFVLRELGMNCVLLLPVVVGGVTWGLAEVYDMRLRSYGPEEIAVGDFLVGQAARRLETLEPELPSGRPLPLFRPPS